MMDEVVQVVLREVMEEFPGITASVAADHDASEHMGSAAGRPLPGAATSIGRTPVTLTDTHTVHTPPMLGPAPSLVDGSAGRPPPNFSFAPVTTHPISPSPPQVPPAIPTWNLGTLFSSPASSTHDFGHLDQYLATGSALPVEAPSTLADALPLSQWDAFHFSPSNTNAEGSWFPTDNGNAT
jgi:hypothetical protein